MKTGYAVHLTYNGTPIGDTNRMPVSLSRILWEIWPTITPPDADVWDVTMFPDVEIHITALTGTATCYRSSSGSGPWLPVDVYETRSGFNGNPVPTMTYAGIFRLPGSGFFKITGATALTLMRRAGL